MRAAVYHDVLDVRIEERPMPKAGPGQMVVRMDYIGVCGSDADRYYHGIGFAVPVDPEKGLVLGHENVGTVYEIGEGVEGFEVGDRVLCGPPAICKELCPACLRGEPEICDHGYERTAGMGIYDGGYQEYMLIHDVARTSIIKLPENVDEKDAVLFDVYCVAIHGVLRSRMKFGDNVVVTGVGGIGMACIAALKTAGARRIIALGTNSAKFPMLKEFGADYCINVKECEDLSGEIRKIFGTGELADVTFECAGNNDSLENAVFKCTKPGGQVVTIGATVVPMTLIQELFNVLEIDLRTTFAFTKADMQLFVDLVAANKIHMDKRLVSSVIPLEDLVEKGFNPDARKGTIRILVDPRIKK